MEVSAGMDAYLSKPVMMEDLYAAIDKAVKSGLGSGNQRAGAKAS